MRFLITLKRLQFTVRICNIALSCIIQWKPIFFSLFRNAMRSTHQICFISCIVLCYIEIFSKTNFRLHYLRICIVYRMYSLVHCLVVGAEW